MKKTDFIKRVTRRGICGDPDLAYEKGVPYYLGFDGLELMRVIHGKSVLDVGSGYAELYCQLIEWNIDVDSYVNLDASYDDPRVVTGVRNIFRERFLRTAITSKWNKTPLDSSSFDFILSCYAFPYHALSTDEVKQTLAEMRRLIKDSGEVCLGPIGKDLIGELRLISRRHFEECLDLSQWNPIFTEVDDYYDALWLTPKLVSVCEEA